MYLAEQLLEQLADPSLSRSERARLRVRLSKALEESGDYEGARQAMGELWSRVGERPVLEGLERRVAAEVLLQSGVLTSCLGSAKQIEGAQDTAKDLVSESMALFESLGDVEKRLEAQTDLAVCYWRQGAFDEARSLLEEVLIRLHDSHSEVKALASIRSAVVERTAARLRDALHILTKATPLFEKISNHYLAGKFHNQFAIVLEVLGTTLNREDYVSRALIEYTAAGFHFEQAGHERFRARVENNLGMLFSTVGKFAEAHQHLDHAQKIFAGLKDSGSVAQVNDTRARVLLAEGRNEEAERVARAAVRALEKGGAQAILAEALTTQGAALARMGQHALGRQTLNRAVVVAEQVGDLEDAGRSALTIIEELSEYLTISELADTYRSAASLLAKSQHPGVRERLTSCSVRVVDLIRGQHVFADKVRPEKFPPPTWEGFSFKREMLRYERFLIKQALEEAGGVIARAALLLGFKHHHSLGNLLNRRHNDLRPAPVVPRRRSLIGPERGSAEKQARPVTILHAEDNRVIADAVRETLELEGWKVDTCSNGATALKRIESDAPYDVLLLDYDLPHVNGLKLLRRARQTLHRKRTPIIMLSATDCEREAWRAGVTAFLRKPDDVLKLAETISRVLVASSKR